MSVLVPGQIAVPGNSFISVPSNSQIAVLSNSFISVLIPGCKRCSSGH